MRQFRLVTSIYEATNIHSILDCRDKRMDNTPLWFMYVTATVQLLMVISINSFQFLQYSLQVVNASINLPIYFFAGKAFRENSVQVIKNLFTPFAINLFEDNNAGKVMLPLISN